MNGGATASGVSPSFLKNCLAPPLRCFRELEKKFSFFVFTRDEFERIVSDALVATTVVGSGDAGRESPSHEGCGSTGICPRRCSVLFAFDGWGSCRSEATELTTRSEPAG